MTPPFTFTFDVEDHRPDETTELRLHDATHRVLDFCAEHGTVSDVEVIPIQSIDEAYERLLKGDVKYRFVIDMASLKVEA